MKRFLCIQRSQKGGGGGGAKPSPADMERMYAAFQAWKDKYAKNLADLGGQLGEGGVVTADSSTDGPFVEVKEVVGGYMIVEAESLAEALEVAQASPGTGMPGSSVEVREIKTS